MFRATAEDQHRATHIRVWRARLRVQQVEVATAVGLSRRMLSHYETGARPMADETFEKILAALQSFEPGRPPASTKSRCVRWSRNGNG